jgi:RecA-family ATPase
VIAPELDQAAVREHVQLLHQLAEPLADRGKLVVASYGEDPASGESLIPKVAHFAIGQVGAMTDMIMRLSREPHRNVYAPLAVVRKDLPDGRKGQEADVVATLGIVCDFDDERAVEWRTRLPRSSDYVLETSVARFQCFFLFSQPQPITDVKPVALRLKTFARCDHGSVDMSHVWRVPGTPNWPNARKAKAGRPLEPQMARVVSPWNGARTELAELAAALPESEREPEPEQKARETAGGAGATETSGSIAEISLDLVLKLLPAWLRAGIAEPDHSGDRSKTLFAVVCGLAALGFEAQVIQRIIEAHPQGVGEKHAGRNDLAREIARILAKKPAQPGPGTGKAPDNGDLPPWVYPEDPWEPLYAPTLQDREVPKRGWVVNQWLPALETTNYTAAGGAGKTLVAMMLATAAALGQPWFNITMPRIKVFALLCEDRRDDVHIRQANINRHHDCDFADLENLLTYPRRSHPRNRLMIFDRDGVGHFTPFFFQVLREVTEFGVELTILDTRADLFLGNQNDEDQARTFVRLVTDRIAEETGGATLLLSHPSRTGAREGTGQSGSVQWDAAFRSRWYQQDKAPEDDDEPADPYARTLTRVKSNFALRDETIEMRWEDGIFIRTDAPPPTGIFASIARTKAERVFLELVVRTAAEGQHLSNSPNAGNYAPKVFVGRADSERVSRRDFAAAMKSLFVQKKIRMVPHGSLSRGTTRIAVVD